MNYLTEPLLLAMLAAAASLGLPMVGAPARWSAETKMIFRLCVGGVLVLALAFYFVIKGESPFETAVRTVLCPMVPTGGACKRVVSAPAQGTPPSDPAGEAAKVDEEKKLQEEKSASEVAEKRKADEQAIADAKLKAENDRKRSEAEALEKAKETKRLNEQAAADAETQRLADEKAAADAAAVTKTQEEAKSKAVAKAKAAIQTSQSPKDSKQSDQRSNSSKDVSTATPQTNGRSHHGLRPNNPEYINMTRCESYDPLGQGAYCRQSNGKVCVSYYTDGHSPRTLEDCR